MHVDDTTLYHFIIIKLIFEKSTGLRKAEDNTSLCCKSMRADLKVRPPVLLCLPTMSEADTGGIAVEVEPDYDQGTV